MNFQLYPVLDPLKVMLVNPIAMAAQLLATKIMSGEVFGKEQLIDLILVVYCNEKQAAEIIKLKLEACAFTCYNSIEISSDIPSIRDAEVFCFITNFTNPNYVDLTKSLSEDEFDTLYLLIKIACNIRGPLPIIEKSKIKRGKSEKKSRKPIFMADGLVGMHILKFLTKDLPADIFFCPTPLANIAKSVLGEHLKVQCNVINDVLVWAANDSVFDIEVEKPLIIHDRVGDQSKCNWNMVGKDLLESLNLDRSQISASWMKKEFIEKVLASASKNPYGCIYKASELAKTLQTIWKSRASENGIKVYANMGVISDGSLKTIKGYSYVFPVVFCGDSWMVNRRYEESIHLKSEIKRINKTVKEYHDTLIPYCKRFLQDNVINQAFVPDDDDSGSVFTMAETGSRPSSIRS